MNSNKAWTVCGLALVYASGSGSVTLFGSPWVKKSLLNRIHINGSRQLGYHLQNISGDAGAYYSSNNFGQGKLSDVGQLTVTGAKVLNLFNFSFQVQNNRFGAPQGQRFSTTYENGPVQLGFGDISASMPSHNTFAGFSRQLNGIQLGYAKGPLNVHLIQSQSRGSVQTVSLQGNGSAGPYYLNASQLLQDSDKVMLDGNQLVRGTDYTLNYESGALTFTRPIAQTSSLVVSFEAFGAAGANIRGFGSSLSLGRLGQIGLISMDQTQRGTLAQGKRTDLFQGFGDPSVPYTLTLPPQPGAIVIITLDGVPQTEGVDYRFDNQNTSVFFFNRYVASTSTVTVAYTPKLTTVVDGDRHVRGLDFTMPLGGNDNHLNFSLAHGSLTNTPTPQSGMARGIGLKTDLGRAFKLESNYSDIDPGYTSVESTGFNRNERALGWTLSTNNAKHLTASLSSTNSVVTTRTSNTDGSFTLTPSRAVTTELKAGFTAVVPWHLTETRQNFASPFQTSQLDTTTLGTDKQFGRWSTKWELENETGKANSLTSNAATTLAMRTLRLTTSSAWGSGLKLTGKVSQTGLSSNGDQSHGADATIALQYNPDKGRFTSNLGYTLSKAGELTALTNFQNGFGQGYGGSGFTGTSVGTVPVSGATGVNSLFWTGSYRASARATLDAHLSSSQSTGSVSSNTRQFSFGGDMNYDLGKGHRMYGTLDITRNTFLSNGSLSRGINMTGDISGPLARQWSYSLRGNGYFNWGSVTSQNNMSVDAALRRRLTDDSNLSIQLRQGLITGYQPQNEQLFGISYERRFWNFISLTSSYRFRNVANSLLNAGSGGAYKSHGLDFELSFNFNQ